MVLGLLAGKDRRCRRPISLITVTHGPTRRSDVHRIFSASRGPIGRCPDDECNGSGCVLAVGFRRERLRCYRVAMVARKFETGINPAIRRPALVIAGLSIRVGPPAVGPTRR